jgi:chaperonin cofactor prefoldin
VNDDKKKQEDMENAIKKLAEQMEKIEKDIEPFRNIVNHMFYTENMQHKIPSRNPMPNHDDEKNGGKK